MTTQNEKKLIIELGLLVALSFLWGSSFTLIKIAVETIPPATMVLARLAIGAFLLLALARMRGVKLPTTPAIWGAFLAQGIIQSALPFTLICWGEKHIDSGLAGLLNSTPPLFVFLISFFVLREGGPMMRKLAGVAVGFSGVAVILGPDAQTGSSQFILGQLAVIGASLSYAVAAIYARRFAGISPLATAAGTMTMATFLMFPVSLYADRPWELTPSTEAVYSVIGLGVLSTALAMVIYFRLVKSLGPLGVTIGSYLRAGFSVLLGIAFLNEEVSISVAAGLLLIFLGVAIVTGHIKWSLRAMKPS